ncbi:MAG: DNA repair protein RecN [Chloroflexota bacterium]
MLTELHIKNFAIIDQLALKFEAGLITFTGETGAGKSIILDALDTLLGSRADTTYVRSGDQFALIEATFTIPPSVSKSIHDILSSEELLDDLDSVVLGREIHRDSRNIARVNGRSVSVGLLRDIGQHLVDLHGQSEHLSLLNVQQHLPLLDRYTDIKEASDQYRASYRQWHKVQNELKSLRKNEQETAQRVDLISYQIAEIEAANLQPGEENELIAERNRLANSEKLSTLGQKALVNLEESTHEHRSISEQLGDVVAALQTLASLDQSQTPLNEQATSIFDEITELSHDLRLYLDNVESNPSRLDEIEERLEMIVGLKRKYGSTIEEIIYFGEKAAQELDTITHAGERISELETQKVELLNTLGKHAHQLSEKRHTAAKLLEKQLDSELEELRMSGARFQVDFQYNPNPDGITLSSGERVAFNENGIENIEFLIESNPGEGFKPLVKVASGGETSRLMLALKNVLAKADQIPTLIFDEIDQGIGGRVGSIVGRKLWQLAQEHQVFCITHLPQLAAFGNQHFRVQKKVSDGRTTTQTELLTGDARLLELAQMLGDVSETTLQSAQEILENAYQHSTI